MGPSMAVAWYNIGILTQLIQPFRIREKSKGVGRKKRRKEGRKEGRKRGREGGREGGEDGGKKKGRMGRLGRRMAQTTAHDRIRLQDRTNPYMYWKNITFYIKAGWEKIEVQLRTIH